MLVGGGGVPHPVMVGWYTLTIQTWLRGTPHHPDLAGGVPPPHHPDLAWGVPLSTIQTWPEGVPQVPPTTIRPGMGYPHHQT